MIGRLVENLLCRVEPEPVEVELFHPVRGVGEVQLTHGVGVVAVEVERLAPLGVPPEVVIAELLQVVPVGAQMVVNDVEDDRDPAPVRRIDERAQLVGGAVVVIGREQIDAVVTPPVITRKTSIRGLWQIFMRCGSLSNMCGATPIRSATTTSLHMKCRSII